MKILIFSEGRVGSHSIGNWLSKELSIPFIPENVDFNYKKNESFIHKIYYDKQNEFLDFNFFDKILIVYRNDTLSQAISNVYAIKNKKYRHTGNKLNGYYNITKEFCIENYSHISELIKKLDISNEELKKINKGLLITYTEIFIDKTGQKKIEDYVGFKAKTELSDPKHKLRETNIEIEEYLKKLIKNNKKGMI